MKVIISILAILMASAALAETKNSSFISPKQAVSGLIEKSSRVATNMITHVMAVTNNMDDFHDTLLLKMQTHVNRFDLFFAKDNTSAQETPKSRFRMGIYVLGKYDDGMNISADPEFDADLELPNLERRWNIFANSMKFSDLPGIDPTETKSVLNTGFGRIFETINVHASLGAKWRSAPIGFARLEWKPSYSAGKWTFYPGQRFFYQSDDEGFGGVSSMTANRWIGLRNFVRSVSAAKLADNTTGVEWEQTVIFGHVDKLIKETARPDIVSEDDAAKGFGARYSIFGHARSDIGVIDKHRLTLVYRRPVLRKWLFLQIAPGAEWTNGKNWKGVPSLQVGLDAIFWEFARN